MYTRRRLYVSTSAGASAIGALFWASRITLVTILCIKLKCNKHTDIRYSNGLYITFITLLVTKKQLIWYSYVQNKHTHFIFQVNLGYAVAPLISNLQTETLCSTGRYRWTYSNFGDRRFVASRAQRCGTAFQLVLGKRTLAMNRLS